MSFASRKFDPVGMKVLDWWVCNNVINFILVEIRLDISGESSAGRIG